jgi:hypothetical protein
MGMKFCCFCLAALFVTQLSASAASAPSDADARAAALQWLSLLDAGQYQEAYRARVPRITTDQLHEHFLEWMRATRAPFGRARAREFRQVKHTHALVGSPDGNYELISFKTSFEHKSEAQEMVVLTSETGKWKVSDYRLY